MGKFTGFATMFMRMPMSTAALPIEGKCTVEDKKMSLKFPFTGIEFELPTAPSAEDGTDFDFKIKGASGEMTISVRYVADLKCYDGVGKQDEDNNPVVTFVFYSSASPMNLLKRP